MLNQKEQTIVDFIVKESELGLHEIVCKSRRPVLVMYRHVLGYLLYNYADSSVLKIGRLLNRNHSSVVVANQKITEALENKVNDYGYGDYRRLIDRAKLMLGLGGVVAIKPIAQRMYNNGSSLMALVGAITNKATLENEHA